MTNPTLERAARALARNRVDPKGVLTDEQAEPAANDLWNNPYIRHNLFRDARAVLMSVRDADGRALRKKVRETQSWLTAREGFTAMIDAILADGGE